MLMWDGDLLNFHFADSNHSLSNWGVSVGHTAMVSSGLHSPTQDLFSSEGLNGHWTLDNLMPVLSAEHLVDLSSSATTLTSDGLVGTVETTGARHDEPSSLALILPTVLKVEEPFAMPLAVDTIANSDLGSDSFIDLTQDLQSGDLMAAKPAWTVPMRMAWRH